MTDPEDISVEELEGVFEWCKNQFETHIRELRTADERLSEINLVIAKHIDDLKRIFKNSKMTIQEFVDDLKIEGMDVDIVGDSIRIRIDEEDYSIPFEELVK